MTSQNRNHESFVLIVWPLSGGRGAAMDEEAYYLSLSLVRLQWRLVEQEIEFSVDPLPLPREVASTVLREDEESYLASCGKTYTIPFFNVRISHSYKPIYVAAMRTLVAAKVQIVVLTKKIRESELLIKKYRETIAKCEEKMQFNVTRMEMYEEEMDQLQELSDNRLNFANRFCMMLAKTAGFACVSKILYKEHKRLSMPQEEKEGAEPSFEELQGISASEALSGVTYCWDLLQTWQLLHSVCLKCKYGDDGYPVTTSAKVLAQKSFRSSVPSGDSYSAPPSPKNADRSTTPFSAAGLGSLSRDLGDEDGEAVTVPPNLTLSRANSGVWTLRQSVPGSGVGRWEDVCAALRVYEEEDYPTYEDDELTMDSGFAELKAPRETLFSRACKAALDLVRAKLAAVVSRTAANSFAAAVGDLNGASTVAPELVPALQDVLSDIGAALEARLLLRLRSAPLWHSMLAELRKIRIRQQGGKLVVREEGDVEITSRGAIICIPFADDYIDSDILHAAMQRVKVVVVLPQARLRLERERLVVRGLRGSRSCLPQLQYCLAVPLLQRTMRTALVRRRYLRLRRNLVWEAVHAAAATLQAWARGCAARAWYRQAQYSRRLAAALLLQRVLRGCMARGRFQQLQRAQLADDKDRAATKVQALIRGVLARRRVRERIQAGMAETKKEEEGWAAVIIQRFARGYIARRTIIRSYRIRNQLSKPLLKATERYLGSGNLWGFLSEIDSLMRRLTHELRDSEMRESVWAETFVRKVLQGRQQEFDGVWNQFHQALTGGGPAMKASAAAAVAAEAGGRPKYEPDPSLSAVGAVSGPVSPVKLDSSTAAATLSPPPGAEERGGGGGAGSVAVPGVLLRRALSASVSEGKLTEASVWVCDLFRANRPVHVFVCLCVCARSQIRGEFAQKG